MVQERLGFIGRIVVSIIGAAWSLATFFVVPVLVLEDRTIPESFRRSVGVFRQTWGETVVGGTTLGAAGICAWLTLVAITGLTAWIAGTIAIAVFVVGAILLMVLFSALHGIYVASLFLYATEPQAVSAFDRTLLGQAFVPKRS
jgi:hypothetical protein